MSEPDEPTPDGGFPPEPTTPGTPPPASAEPEPAAVLPEAVSSEPASPLSPAPRPPAPRDVLKQLSRRSFITGAIAGAAAIGGWQWLISRPKNSGLPWPLRWALEANDAVSTAVYAPARLAPTFERARARMPRTNGLLGLKQPLDLADWRLLLEDEARTGTEPQPIPLSEVLTLPRVAMTTQLMCIEGWSQIVHWSGVRLADFVARYAPAWADPARAPGQYVSLATPDKAYFVGLDLASALHPQTILCDRMNDEPLSDKHGAPLRLVIPVKYGIKNIKRIGTIGFHRKKPADYWENEGYDWFAGL